MTQNYTDAHQISKSDTGQCNVMKRSIKIHWPDTCYPNARRADQANKFLVPTDSSNPHDMHLNYMGTIAHSSLKENCIVASFESCCKQRYRKRTFPDSRRVKRDACEAEEITRIVLPRLLQTARGFIQVTAHLPNKTVVFVTAEKVRTNLEW